MDIPKYKNDEYMKNYYNEYYKNVRVPKLRANGVKSKEEYLKDIETKYFNKVLNAHKTLLADNKKTTAKNIAVLAEIDIKTARKHNKKVIKYLSIQNK